MLRHTRLNPRACNQRWLQQQANDTFVREARRQGYVARSALKLTHLDDRYRLFSRQGTRTVIDLGCSPGGWCQVIRQRAGDDCHIIGLDLLNVRASITNAVFLQGDFSSPALQSALLRQLSIATTSPRQRHGHDGHGENSYLDANRADSRAVDGDLVSTATPHACVDVVTSDMCPNRMGGPQDRHRIAALNEKALTFSLPLLREGGHFVCKVLGSEASYEELCRIARANFKTVRLCKPPASRINSDESFLVAHTRLAECCGRSCGKRCDDGEGHSARHEQLMDLDHWPGFARGRRR